MLFLITLLAFMFDSLTATANDNTQNSIFKINTQAGVLPFNKLPQKTIPNSSASEALNYLLQNHSESSNTNLQWTSFTALKIVLDPEDALVSSVGPACDVGPEQLILLCNRQLISFNKTSSQPDGMLELTLDELFSSIMPEGFQSYEGHIRYDRWSGHWLVITSNMNTLSPNTTNSILIAISDNTDGIITSDTTWTFISLQPDQLLPLSKPDIEPYFANSLTLGIDQLSIYLGVNVFSETNGSWGYVTSNAFVIPKTALYSKQFDPNTVLTLRDLSDRTTYAGISSPQGVSVYDPNSKTGFFIGVDGASYGQLDLITIRYDAQDNPRWNGFTKPIKVGTTSQPYPIPQPKDDKNGYTCLDVVDDRLTQAHIRFGHLYTAHSILTNQKGISTENQYKKGSHTSARWYDIDITNPVSPSLVQAGTLYTSSSNLFDVNYLMPAVITNGLNMLVLGCCSAGTDLLASSAFAMRYATDSPGTLCSPIMSQEGFGVFNFLQSWNVNQPNPWGEFSTAIIDPSDDLTMWVLSSYACSEASYAIEVTKVMAPPPPSKLIPVPIAPPYIKREQPSITVRIRCDKPEKHSIFFQSDQVYANHLPRPLSISFDPPDVEVLSIDSVTPTEIIFKISTVKAKMGRKKLIVFNPDGQTASYNYLDVYK